MSKLSWIPALLVCGTLNAQTPDQSPNVVFILVDDLGVMDLGIENHEDFYETPRIDALAKKGMRFKQGYTSCQVCSPARASLMLGMDPAHHGMTDWVGAEIGAKMARKQGGAIMPPDYVRALPAERTTIAEAFKEAGYETFFAGKWHLGPKGSWPEDHGFDTNLGGWDSGSPRGGFFAPWAMPTLPSGHDGESLTLHLARKTADFIKSDKDKPFFAYLSFYAVHSPLQTSNELWSKYRTKSAAMEPREERFKIDRKLPVRIVRDNPVYAGMLETLDNAVGIVMDALEDAGISENTIICFTSDHGGVVSGDHYSTSMLPLRGGKGRQWEGGLRVPAYIYAPGVTQPGSTTETPLIGTDFFPTLLDLAGHPQKIDEQIDGVSLVPVLKGGNIENRPLFWHYPHYGNQGGDPSSIIRSGDWKLIHYWEDQRRELYNLAKDPGELSDVAPSNPELVSELGSQLDAYLTRMNANLPKPWPGYKEEMRTAREQRSIQIKKKLEVNHAKFLDPKWQPNKDWWGSSRGED